MRASKFLPGLSHRLARYSVKRDRADRFLGYTGSRSEISCEEVLNVFRMALGKMHITAVREHLTDITQCDYRMEASITLYLKRIF